VSFAPVLLEINIPTSNVLDSLDWYVSLGFQEIPVGDTRDYHYAVVTDGRICIGLHGVSNDAIGLSFILPDVARHAREMIEQGIESQRARIGSEEFHEVVYCDPDGQEATLLEARTFSQQPDEDIPPPAIGRMSHLSLACSNLENSLQFWQDYGFTGVAHVEQQYAELYGGKLQIELRAGTRRCLLNFSPDNSVDCLDTLDRLSINHPPLAGGILLTAPEGTGLWLAVDD
jgi:catechol 2,3-dioxygenase-like lactoylglutathione lyase family enzyme